MVIKVVWFQILWKLSLPDICEHPRSSSSSSLKSQWQCHFHLLIHSRCYGNRKANASWGPLWLQWLILFQWIVVKKTKKTKKHQIMHHWASLLLFFKNSFWTQTRCDIINHLCESCSKSDFSGVRDLVPFPWNTAVSHTSKNWQHEANTFLNNNMWEFCSLSLGLLSASAWFPHWRYNPCPHILRSVKQRRVFLGAKVSKNTNN